MLRLGTRSSKLARWQAEWVATRLARLGHAVTLVPITTSGDQTTGPLSQYGGVGVFTKEIQKALLAEQVDLAVHSLKDLPTESVPGLAIAAVPSRARVHDVLIGPTVLAELPKAARVGTGSLRRRAQLLHERPDLTVVDIRGNVETRLNKLDSGDFDAILLARAGLERLGLAARITEEFSIDRMMPAVGQGALGVETRVDDERTVHILRRLNDADVFRSITAERRLLSKLQAGCLAPIGATAAVDKDTLVLRAVVVSPDGQNRLATQVAGPAVDAVKLGDAAAKDLLEQGAGVLIAQAKGK